MRSIQESVATAQRKVQPKHKQIHNAVSLSTRFRHRKSIPTLFFSLLKLSILIQKEIGLEFLRSLISEFQANCDSVEMTQEYHFNCHRTFEPLLFSFFQVSTQFLQNMTVFVNNLNAESRRLLLSCLSLIHEILQWDFSASISFLGYLSANLKFSQKRSRANMSGKEWANMLVKNAHVLHFFGGLQKQVRKDSELNEMCLNIITQLSSISGKIFDHKEEQKSYLGFVLALTVQLVSTSHEAGSTRELVLVAQIVHTISTNFNVTILFSVKGFLESFLPSVTKFTCDSLQALQSFLTSEGKQDDEEVEECWQMKTFSVLLSACKSSNNLL